MLEFYGLVHTFCLLFVALIGDIPTEKLTFL